VELGDQVIVDKSVASTQPFVCLEGRCQISPISEGEEKEGMGCGGGGRGGRVEILYPVSSVW
jgi:hypothetical protein